MKIGYDAKRAFENQTGLGNYSRDLINNYSLSNPKLQILLFAPKIFQNKRLDFLKSRQNVKIVKPKNFFYRFFQSIWRSFGILIDLKREKVDVFHGLSHEIPFGIDKTKIKTVVTIHDLIFLRLPQYFNIFDRLIYYYKIKYACKKSDKIIAISNQTKSDIMELFKIEPKKIEVVYQSCNSVFKSQTKNIIKKDLGLPKNYILYVSSIEERKNLLSLIKVLKIMKSKNLVVIGNGKDYKKKCVNYIKNNNLQKRIFFMHNLNLDEIAIAYRNASILVYPSIYEGFGIPILEALYSKIPVITTRGGCFEEAGGTHTKYVDTKNTDEIVSAIKEIEDNADVRKKMIDNGYAHAKTFCDKSINEKLNNIYSELLNGSRS